MLINLAVWYLRKRKKSVLIGYEIKNGHVKCLNKDALLYDNYLYDVTYRTYDNYPLWVPEGKFNISRQDNFMS